MRLSVHKQCKDCKYFKSISCSKDNSGTPFFVSKEDPCWYELSDVICAECEHYSIAEGTTWDMDIGGCTYSGGIRATMQSNPCTSMSYLINRHGDGLIDERTGIDGMMKLIRRDVHYLQEQLSSSSIDANFKAAIQSALWLEWSEAQESVFSICCQPICLISAPYAEAIRKLAEVKMLTRPDVYDNCLDSVQVYLRYMSWLKVSIMSVVNAYKHAIKEDLQ